MFLTGFLAGVIVTLLVIIGFVLYVGGVMNDAVDKHNRKYEL